MQPVLPRSGAREARWHLQPNLFLRRPARDLARRSALRTEDTVLEARRVAVGVLWAWGARACAVGPGRSGEGGVGTEASKHQMTQRTGSERRAGISRRCAPCALSAWREDGLRMTHPPRRMEWRPFQRPHHRRPRAPPARLYVAHGVKCRRSHTRCAHTHQAAPSAPLCAGDAANGDDCVGRRRAVRD